MSTSGTIDAGDFLTSIGNMATFNVYIGFANGIADFVAQYILGTDSAAYYQAKCNNHHINEIKEERKVGSSGGAAAL